MCIRDRAVIDLDGTMLGEELDYKDGKYLMNSEPYPVPLLCIDTTGHYVEGLKLSLIHISEGLWNFLPDHSGRNRLQPSSDHRPRLWPC